jgi:RNA recognition motif-containing protein
MNITNTKLLVTNLSGKFSGNDLDDIFGRYGRIKDITIVDSDIAIINFEDYLDTQDALKNKR